MIGNDVVDLDLARTESNWRRAGYLEKIFTASEQNRIYSSPDPDLVVWQFWSRKEAAYKLYVRETGREGYFPKRIVCDFGNFASGLVRIGSWRAHTFTTLYGNSQLHSIALRNPKHLFRVQNLHRSVIEKRGRLPFWNGNPASVSHHGRFEQIVGLDLQAQFGLEFQEQQRNGVGFL